MIRGQYSIILITLALTLIGIWMIPKLSLSFDHYYGNRSISISYNYPSAHPRVIESSVTVPIEGALSLIPGVNQVISEVKYGSGVTRVIIDKDADIAYVRFEMAQMMRQVHQQLPDEVPFPSMYVNNPEEKEVDPTLLTYSLIGSISRQELFQYAQEVLVPRLSLVSGVYEIRISGAEKMEWILEINTQLLETLGIRWDEAKSEVGKYLRSQGLNYTYDNEQVKYIRIESEGIEALSSAKIGLKDGGIISLSSILYLKSKEARPIHYYRVNGKNSINLRFIPKSNANHLTTAKEVKEVVGNSVDLLPPDSNLLLSYDSTEYIATELSKIQSRTIWSLCVLLLFVVFAYRRLSYMFVILASLIANLGIASLFYHALGVNLNLYALAAVTVSFGLILDNIIVVAHHYERYRNLTVFPSLITICLTTLLALGIIFFLPLKLQWELGDFAMVLCINLTVSIAVAILLVPALIDQFGIRKKVDEPSLYGNRLIRLNLLYKVVVLQLQRYRRFIIIGMILLFGLPVYWLPSNIDGWESYNKTLGHEYYQEEMRPWVNKLLGGTLRLFIYYTYEGSSFRSPDETLLYVNAAMPQGSTLEQMDELIGYVEAYLGAYTDEIESFVTRVEAGEYANIRISFKPETKSSFPYILKNRLQSLAIDLEGVEWSIYGVGRGFSNSSGGSPPRFKVLFKGYNQDQLQGYAEQLAIQLEVHPRIQKVNRNSKINWWEKDKDEYLLQLDDRKLAFHGSNKQELAALFERYNQRPQLIAYTEKNEAVRIQSSEIEKQDLWLLQHKQHMLDTAAIVLGQIGNVAKRKTSNSIHKEDQQYLQLLEFEYTGSGWFGSRYLNETLESFVPQLPLGFSAERDQNDFWRTTQQKQYGLIGLVMIAIFFVCTIHFESFRFAFIVITLIPMSFIGVFITFYWFDFPFDQGGYTSFLLLSGLVVNSLILILSDYSRNKKLYPHRTGTSMYLRAFRGKITPIFLTIVSTSCGLIPFAMHGAQEVFWFSLAMGTIGGLIFSLFLLFFVVPVFIKR